MQEGVSTAVPIQVGIFTNIISLAVHPTASPITAVLDFILREHTFVSSQCVTQLCVDMCGLDAHFSYLSAGSRNVAAKNLALDSYV